MVTQNRQRDGNNPNKNDPNKKALRSGCLQNIQCGTLFNILLSLAVKLIDTEQDTDTTERF